MIGGNDDQDWQSVAARKRDDRERCLSQYSDLRLAVSDDIKDVSEIPLSRLTHKEQQIVKNDVTALAELIKIREYTSVEVLTAFIKVAVIAQDLTNCLTEISFDKALERAKELDEHLQKTGQVVGPLHGVPVSIKDHIKVKGLDTSSGYVDWAYKTVADFDAVAVKILREAGAVLYVKTQNPQTLLMLETDNNIYGRTSNPFNRNLTAGGSSGGESALISIHGSPLGIGTDIGGSVRLPSGHCGLYGLKGSVGRLPHDGLLGSHAGMDAIVGCVGPMTTSARDLELFCRVMLDVKPWLIEAPLIEIPWKSDVAKGASLPTKLSIAILWDDGVVSPHPPITAAMERYKAALIAAGHDVIDWQPLDHLAGWELISKLYFLDGGAEYLETMKASGEPPVPLIHWILSQNTKKYAVDEIFRLNAERDKFRAKGLAHWNATQERTLTGRPVDAILCPVHPTLAAPHDTTRWWGYTSHWNLLDLPGVVFPTGRFKASDQWPTTMKSDPRNDTERYVHEQWNPQTYDNVPVSLQLIGRRFNEEKTLAILGVIEKAAADH